MWTCSKTKRAVLLVYLAGMLLLVAWLAGVSGAGVADQAMPLTFRSPVGDPQLSLVKSVSPPVPQAGGLITYVLTYSNTQAGSEAYNVRLYEFLPAGVRFVSSVPPASSYRDGVLVFTAPSITSSVGAPQNTMRVTVTVQAVEGYEGLYNHALLTADCVTPTHSSLLQAVEQPPRWLNLTVIGYSEVLTGGRLVYRLRARNTSDVTVNAVTLANVLPDGLPLAEASSWPDEVKLPALRWSLGNLAPNQSRTIVITTTAPDSVGVISNTTLVDARQRVMTQTVFATEVVTRAAILRVTKQASQPEVDWGAQLVYTIRYWNDGNVPATDVWLTDTFPVDIIVTGAFPTPTLITNQQGVWSLGVISPTLGGEIVVTTTVRGAARRTLYNAVNIAGQPSDVAYQAYSGHYEVETWVRPLILYLPVMAKNY